MMYISLWKAAVKSIRGSSVIIPMLLLSNGVYLAISGTVKSQQILEGKEMEKSRVCFDKLKKE